MGERLKVTLAGGHEEFLDVAATNAHGLESLIVDGKVGKGVATDGKPHGRRPSGCDRRHNGRG